ncbi:MAG TPA: helix-turn-helix transcriptional regulator [Caulifigura sp.]|nr:helix-turn-helix transcriptional regulator [Caulifigura sp.]
MNGGVPPGDREFLSLMLRLGASGIAELCDAAEVTATAVRQRLTRLQTAGFVERKAVRADRGRPHHVYEVTDAGRRSLGRDNSDLAVLLWQGIQGIEDSVVREKLLARLKDAMVGQFRQQMAGGSPEERMRELASVLKDRGFEVDLGEKPGSTIELPILRGHTCPFPEIAEHDSTICELEQKVFGELVGSPLELTRCRQRGDCSCEFEAVSHV